MKIISTSSHGWEKALEELLDRSRAIPHEVDETVRTIIEKVRMDGDQALFAYTREFDCFDPERQGLVISQAAIAHAAERTDRALLEALGVAAARIRAFHEHQREDSWTITDESGSVLGLKISPVGRAGVYIPGGRNAFPSTLLMNVIPAQIAGVKEIVVVSPTPKGRVSDVLLAAAKVTGVERIYRIGGAQAVAALAFGTASVPKVDKVVGPGNIYVAHAKRILQGIIGIDAIAGPSEIVVIADAGADPRWVAIDLLAQAEHDPNASAMLLTPEEALIKEVVRLIAQEQETLPRKEVIAAALKNHGACILTHSLEEALEIANAIAPEHLELMVKNPHDYLGMIENAGAVFLGYHCMESIGDYIAGPNHTLPTAATARFYSPLGVYDFLKRTSIVGLSKRAVMELGPLAARLARAEELEAHARAVDCRLS